MKENRYFQMIYLLLEKGRMTAPALAEHFEVSVRTIYRDIDILSTAGIPIYATQGKGGGISIQEGFVLNKSILSEQEQKQILMALQGIHIVDDENTSVLLSKLSGAFQQQNVNWLEIDFSGWKSSKSSKENFNLLKQAILKKLCIRFLYSSHQGKSMNRLVEPLKLVFKQMNWFLYGYCCYRNDFRLFKLTRIRKLEVTNDEYIRSAPEQIFGEAETFVEEMVQVTLLFHRDMSFRVYDEFEEGITENEDGSLLVNTSLPANDRLFSYLFSFGDQVQVVAPEIIREEMRIRIKKIQLNYIT